MTQDNSDAIVTDLSFSDLRNAVIVIDHAADQGAFKGWDTIEKVQMVRNRLLAILATEPPAAPVKAEPEGPAIASGAPTP